MLEKNRFITKHNGKKLFVNILENDKYAPNIIYIQTPICSVVELQECYFPLRHYGFNVFALDLSGIGRSEGDIKNFSMDIVHEDINICIKYIKENYNSDIHLFGGMGTGGFLAQHYISGNHSLKSFVQYGVAIHNNTSPLGNPIKTKIMHYLLPLLKICMPDIRIKFKPKKFNGKHAEREKQWYDELSKNKPDRMIMTIGLIETLLSIFIGKDSNIKRKPTCPVLVLAPKHDRYFSIDYINSYYEWLDEPKELFEIDDSHLSFLWHADDICKRASQWFYKHSSSYI